MPRPPDKRGFKLIVVGRELNEAKVKHQIFLHDGNLTAAAKEMRVDPARLRAFVYAKPELKAAMAETIEQGVDLAVAVIFEGLRDEGSFQNRFYAAKQMLAHDVARKRGFGRDTGGVAAVQIGRPSSDSKPTTISIRWMEEGEDIKTIEGEKLE